MIRFFIRLLSLAVLLAFCALAALLIGASVIYDRLPPLDDIIDYRPRLPMRIYSAEGDLIGEFGEERRTYTRYQDYPANLINALLATEDQRFFSHQGLDWVGIGRAAIGYVFGRREGASTITMQLARNFYLTRERTLLRKFTEIILAMQVEKTFIKEEILERYMNQIYLGQGSYGFTAAAREYYAKSFDELTIGEIAVLVGLPKSPSGGNPRDHPKRAKVRQNHVLKRMYDNQLIDLATYQEWVDAKLPITSNSKRTLPGTADYLAEEVRKVIFQHFGNAAYERGFRIYTTIQSAYQRAALKSLRDGLLAHQTRRPYLGPEKFIDINNYQLQDFQETLSRISTIGGLQPAIVTLVTPNQLQVITQDGQSHTLTNQALDFVRKSLQKEESPIKPGAVIRLLDNDGQWQVVDVPKASAAFVALSSDDGAILAMVGGFDFAYNQFNNTRQAHRQPGSAIKPFIYSAALEKGFMPASLLSDTPIFLSEEETGSGETWQPKNYDGKFGGFLTLRKALAQSKNLATINLLKYIGVAYSRDYLSRFGFNREDHPPYLTLGLGAGRSTPLEMAQAYAVFANGGYLVNPYMISRIEDYDGNKIVNELDYQKRRVAIDPRNAFILRSLLASVIEEGTGTPAKRIKRSDIGGKTGTTNDTRDAWFAGFGGDITAVAWVGYSNFSSLGYKETGSRTALPIWRNFMESVLKNNPEVQYLLPSGIVIAPVNRENGRRLNEETSNSRQEYFYNEYLPLIQEPSNPTIEEETQDLF